MTINYKPAQLSKGKRWFIFYYYLIPGTTKYQRFKEYFDMNHITDKAERKIYADEAIAFLNKKLALGFNPYTVIKVKNADAPRIIDQVKQIADSFDVSATTMETYTTMKNRLIKFIDIEGLHHISIGQVDIDVANQFKEWMEKSLSKKSINSTLAHLGLFWKRAIKLKMAVVNPFESVERVKRSFSDDEREDVFEPLTFDELELITAQLENKQQHNFIRFLNMIYCAWARPVEICRLQVGDIDLRRDVIIFRKPGTKSKKGAMVQMIPQLKTLLSEMKLENYDKEYFIFSKNYMPGPEMLDSEIPMNKWRSLVQQDVEKGGLGIKKKMYALKHTGNIEYLLSNKARLNLKWQQSQNRHSSAAMTERYNRKLGAYFIECSDIKFKRI